MINRKGCETLGYARDELLGQNWFATCLPQPEGIDRVYPVLRRIMTGELDALEYYENPVRCRNGHLRLIAWHNASLTDAAGEMAGTLRGCEETVASSLERKEPRSERRDISRR